jgi:hypothetical protein
MVIAWRLGDVASAGIVFVLAYNIKRMITIIGMGPLMAAIRT